MLKLISFQIEDDVLLKVKNLCKESDRTMSSFIRLAINDYIKKAEENEKGKTLL